MTDLSTSKPLQRRRRMTDGERKAKDADRAARWRAEHAGRVPVPIANRVIVDAFLHRLSLEGPEGSALLLDISRLAIDGLRNAGFEADEARQAIKRRVETLQSERPSEVRQAARNRRLGRDPEGYRPVGRRAMSRGK